MLIGDLDQQGVICPIAFKVKDGCVFKCPILFQAEKSMVSFLICGYQFVRKGCIAIGVCPITFCNYTTNGLVFPKPYMAKFKQRGWGIGHRIGIEWVGTISDFIGIAKTVPIDVQIVVVLRTIPIQIFDHIGNCDSEVFVEGCIVIVRCTDGDGVVTIVGLVVECGCGTQGAIVFEIEGRFWRIVGWYGIGIRVCCWQATVHIPLVSKACFHPFDFLVIKSIIQNDEFGK